MKFSNIKDKIVKLSLKQRIFAIIIGVFLIINIVLGIFAICVYRNKSSVQLETFGSENMFPLKALNRPGRKGVVENNEIACFKFSQEQKALLEEFSNENKNLALTIRIQVLEDENTRKNSGELPFQYGFILENDFSPKGKFNGIEYPDNKRTLIHGNLSQAPDVFDISFALKKNNLSGNELPQGFFVYSSVSCKILAACVVPVEIGFDISGEVPFYGFSCNGGVIDFTNKSFDFSGAPLIFPTKTSEITSLPEFCIKLSDVSEFKSKQDSSVYGYLNFGGERIKVKNVAPAEKVVIPTGGLKSPFSPMKIDKNEMCINAVIMRPTNVAGKKVIKPIITDPGLILNYNTGNWRTVDYELYEWDRYHKILFFDTRNYEVQDNFFRRMAYFVEKKGYQGRLLTNEELEGKHGYNAHDYSAISMAKFFNQAYDMNFPLNYEEILLKEILLENDLFEISEDGVHVTPNEGGLVSISQESAGWLRNTFLAHEGWHTIFFRDEEFRNFVSAVYYTMDTDSRDFIIDYFASQPQLGYDPNDDYLMKNEFMAYIMQQGLSEVANYFVHLANRGSVMAYTPDLAAYIRETHAIHIEDAALALNDFVFDKYGIVCGNICLVSR